jgi:hypothetical protein
VEECVGEGSHEVEEATDEIVALSRELEVVPVRPGVVAPVSAVFVGQGVRVRIPVGRALGVEVPRVPDEDPRPIHLGEKLGLEGLIGLPVNILALAEAGAEVRVHRMGATV